MLFSILPTNFRHDRCRHVSQFKSIFSPLFSTREFRIRGTTQTQKRDRVNISVDFTLNSLNNTINIINGEQANTLQLCITWSDHDDVMHNTTWWKLLTQLVQNIYPLYSPFLYITVYHRYPDQFAKTTVALFHKMISKSQTCSVLFILIPVFLLTFRVRTSPKNT